MHAGPHGNVRLDRTYNAAAPSSAEAASAPATGAGMAAASRRCTRWTDNVSTGGSDAICRGPRGAQVHSQEAQHFSSLHSRPPPAGPTTRHRRQRGIGLAASAIRMRTQQRSVDSASLPVHAAQPKHFATHHYAWGLAFVEEWRSAPHRATLEALWTLAESGMHHTTTALFTGMRTTQPRLAYMPPWFLKPV